MCNTCWKSLGCNATECEECGQWRRYWDSLTPEQKESELDAMSLYASEADYLA